MRDADCVAGSRLAEAAAGFLGTRFRLHGRDPEMGLDCVGLLDASLRQMGRSPDLPSGYQLRNASVERWTVFAFASGFGSVVGPVRRGDVLLLTPGPAQHHLVIVDDMTSAIHAHASLRRVVRQQIVFPLSPPHHWRLT